MRQVWQVTKQIDELHKPGYLGIPYTQQFFEVQKETPVRVLNEVYITIRSQSPKQTTQRPEFQEAQPFG